MKIHPVGAELFMRMDRREDGQVGTTKLIVDFRKFANAPKNFGNACMYQAVARHAVRTHDVVFKQHDAHFSYIT